ncbi:MAG: MBL fold metallo-hydrolase [Gordonia paraffinivorans]
MTGSTIETLDDGRGGHVHFVQTDHVNWVLLQDDSGVTLIDGGYPKQADAVEDSFREVGASPSDVRAALVTHAHVDHIGGLRLLAERHGFPVHADAVEVGHVRRDFLQQAGPADLAPLVWRPRVARWLVEVSRLGVLDRSGIDAAQPFPAAGDLELPGRPRPVACPGHTSGHSTYLVAGGHVLVSGDALITGHGTSSVHGPQCLPKAFHHDLATNRASVQALAALDVDVVLPGHGPRVPRTDRGGGGDGARVGLTRRTGKRGGLPWHGRHCPGEPGGTLPTPQHRRSPPARGAQPSGRHRRTACTSRLHTGRPRRIRGPRRVPRRGLQPRRV